jgi:hypothetical protein
MSRPARRTEELHSHRERARQSRRVSRRAASKSVSLRAADHKAACKKARQVEQKRLARDAFNEASIAASPVIIAFGEEAYNASEYKHACSKLEQLKKAESALSAEIGHDYDYKLYQSLFDIRMSIIRLELFGLIAQYFMSIDLGVSPRWLRAHWFSDKSHSYVKNWTSRNVWHSLSFSQVLVDSEDCEFLFDELFDEYFSNKRIFDTDHEVARLIAIVIHQDAHIWPSTTVSGLLKLLNL